MRPGGGFLIAAVLVLAIAAGCRRDDRPTEAAHGGAPRSGAGPGPAGIAAVKQTPGADSAPAGPAASSRPSLGQARDELDKLARDARLLRQALLEADFRDLNNETKEADDDSR